MDSTTKRKYKRRYYYRSKSANGNRHRRNVVCSNCNRRGHIFRDCRKPIQSNGILAWTLRPTPKGHFRAHTLLAQMRESIEGPHDERFLEWMRRLEKSGAFQWEVCIIQRKHTIGFEAFVRGKWSGDELELLRERMTVNERARIRRHSWEHLYESVMSDKEAKYIEKEKRKAKELFDTINVHEFLKEEQADSAWEEPTWEFPKGRRFTFETDRQCALREFQEETSIVGNDVWMSEKWCEERFAGMNKRIYRNKYYVALVVPWSKGPYIDKSRRSQVTEVKNTRWATLQEALDLLRPYHMEKKSVLRNSFEAVKEILLE